MSAHIGIPKQIAAAVELKMSLIELIANEFVYNFPINFVENRNLFDRQSIDFIECTLRYSCVALRITCHGNT